MAATLEELEKRVTALERELAVLRQQLPPLTGTGRLGDEVPMIREARAMQPILSAITAKAFAEMGIPDAPPVSIEELRRMMIECGVKPEDNVFSREIIAMREE